MGPLSQVTVVECGEGITAAFAGRLLADLGAGVIKVESPQGDITRLRGAFSGGAGDAENSGLFLYLNAGKRGITLDLHNAGERAKLQTLLGRADVLLHNLPPCEHGRLVKSIERSGIHSSPSPRRRAGGGAYGFGDSHHRQRPIEMERIARPQRLHRRGHLLRI